MAKSEKSFPYQLPGDRPATPPELLLDSQAEHKHPHPLRAHPTLPQAARSSRNTASSRRLPANPPTTPAKPTASPEPPSSSLRRPQSPLSPPVTPPPAPPQYLNTPAFKFSRRLMTSKKLSSSVHGKPSPLEVEHLRG